MTEANIIRQIRHIDYVKMFKDLNLRFKEWEIKDILPDRSEVLIQANKKLPMIWVQY